MNIFLIALNILVLLGLLVLGNFIKALLLQNLRKGINEEMLKFDTKINNNINVNVNRIYDLVSQNINNMAKAINENSTKNTDTLNNFRIKFRDALTEDFDKIGKTLDAKLNHIDTKVNQNIEKSFEKTNKTFQDIIERMGKIDEAQKNIEKLSSNVVSLEKVLADKQNRGAFGEMQLKKILESIFGEKNDSLYQLQYDLKTASGSVRPDAVLFYPNDIGLLCIDSKFPLENYKTMIERRNVNGVNDSLFKEKKKAFTNDMKIKLKDISTKYIIDGQTMPTAMLFLPSEAIFSEIVAYHQDIVEYAHQTKVSIVSPTTFMAICNIIWTSTKDIELNKNAEFIRTNLMKLRAEFSRYNDRWTKLSNQISTVDKTAREMTITTDKITKTFDGIDNQRNLKENIGIEKEIKPLDEIENVIKNTSMLDFNDS